jgi:nucleotide-binding universal stress UspA family protein
MRIVIGVDGSKPAHVAAELVAATVWPNAAVIQAVNVLEGHRRLRGAGDPPSCEREAHDIIDAAVSSLRDRYAIEKLVTVGRPADVLLEAAMDPPADLIVVGNRGLGVAASAMVGSVSATLVDQAPCPVLVARGPAVSRILLATDGSQSSEHIPAVLAAWKVFTRAPIDVLAVNPRTDAGSPGTATWMLHGDARSLDAGHDVDRYRSCASDMAARLARAGWRAEPRVRHGDPAHEIESTAMEAGADLIILGSRGLSGLQRLLLGSVAHDVLLHSTASVLVMRGHVPGWRQRKAVIGALASA